jgi:hypothetical protein
MENELVKTADNTLPESVTSDTTVTDADMSVKDDTKVSDTLPESVTDTDMPLKEPKRDD